MFFIFLSFSSLHCPYFSNSAPWLVDIALWIKNIQQIFKFWIHQMLIKENVIYWKKQLWYKKSNWNLVISDKLRLGIGSS